MLISTISPQGSFKARSYRNIEWERTCQTFCDWTLYFHCLKWEVLNFKHLIFPLWMGVICSSGLAGDFWNSWSMMKFKWSQIPKLTVETFLIFNLLPPELVEKGWGQREREEWYSWIVPWICEWVFKRNKKKKNKVNFIRFMNLLCYKQQRCLPNIFLPWHFIFL